MWYLAQHSEDISPSSVLLRLRLRKYRSAHSNIRRAIRALHSVVPAKKVFLCYLKICVIKFFKGKKRFSTSKSPPHRQDFLRTERDTIANINILRNKLCTVVTCIYVCMYVCMMHNTLNILYFMMWIINNNYFLSLWKSLIPLYSLHRPQYWQWRRCYREV